MGVFSIFTNKGGGGEVAALRRMSTVFAVLKFLFLFVFVAFVLYGFSFRTREISMDNFRYLFRTAIEGENKPEPFKTVYFDNNDDNRYALVRGDLAVVNSNGNAVYTLSGRRQSVDPGLKLDNPMALSSAKNLFIYDLGGNELVIKNALETVKRYKYVYPIRGAAVAESGYFAVISSEKTSRSVIYVYDDRYRVVYDCSYGSLYTLSVDLDADAERLLAASVDAENGGFTAYVTLYALDREEPAASLSFEGEYPYRACFSDGGGFTLLTDKYCRFFDGSAKLVSALEFGSKGISSYAISGSYFLRQYATSVIRAERALEVYDCRTGELLWQRNFDGGIRLAKSCGDCLFVISGGELTVVRLTDGKEALAEIPAETIELLPIENGQILALTNGTGNVLDYGALFENNTEEK